MSLKPRARCPALILATVTALPSGRGGAVQNYVGNGALFLCCHHPSAAHVLAPTMPSTVSPLRF